MRVLFRSLALDLREILATLRIVSDIERIGDYAANAAKRSIALNTLPPLPHTRGLQGLGTLAVQQLRAVLEAYRDNDPDAAQRVRARDAELDMAYTSLFRELLTYMMEDARAITPCTHLLFIAKNLERVGDHVTNIAENRSEEHTSELQSLMRISYAVFCFKKKQTAVIKNDTNL